MKRLFFSLCAVGLSCAAFGAGPEVNIVPKPLSVTPGAGTFTVTASTVIGVGKNAGNCAARPGFSPGRSRLSSEG